MSPKFQIKAVPKIKTLKQISIITIVSLSFLLVFFSKTDYYIINSVKSISSNLINPVSYIVSAPINIFSNLITEFNQFKNFQARLLESNWSKAADEMMDSRWAKQVKTRALRLEKIMRTGQLL